MSYADMLQGRFEQAPLARKALQCVELIVLFAVPLTFLLFAVPKVGDNPVARQGVVWLANVAMLVIVYLGLRLRGQTWAHFGLAFGKPRRAAVFGLIHFDWGPVGMVQTAFGGLVLAIAYLKVKRNLWVNILAHGYMDTILMVPLYFIQGSE